MEVRSVLGPDAIPSVDDPTFGPDYFGDPEHGVRVVAGETGRFRADGTSWDGASGENDDGRTLTRVPARRRFAFAWRDDHGEEAFFEG